MCSFESGRRGGGADLQSLMRVSAALIHYADAEDDFLLGSNPTLPLKSLKKLRHGINGVRRTSLKPKQKGAVQHLRPGGNPSVSAEEEPEPEERGRVGSYYNPPANQSSLWDQLWNLFPSLDSYGYPSWTDYDRMVEDEEDTDALRKIREEEGIPELEPVSEEEDGERTEIGKPEPECKHAGVQVGGGSSADSTREFENVKEGKDESSGPEGIKESGYSKRRAGSMAEVMKDMELLFMRICESSSEVSVVLEAPGRAQNSHVWKAGEVRNQDAIFSL